MITPSELTQVAKLLAGSSPGWQARFAAIVGISRSHASNALTGARPIAASLEAKVIEAGLREADALEQRARELRAKASHLKRQLGKSAYDDDHALEDLIEEVTGIRI